ncbi:IS30 family transposase [Salinisphaera sp. Q1T1-3]|uniref:IS30 family transposase n=1 Tax=Salinisphaera sp. Q1T1-3 TaxID=2321229 RepID=UPI001F3E5D88|nr:IS30 family transposase [Salinisphaera sp. Q1T1-3]
MYQRLRRRHKRRGRRTPRAGHRARRDTRLDIHQRPDVVDRRGRFGDWEGDTVMGSGRAVIVTHVERRSGYIVAFKQPHRASMPLAKATVAALRPFPARFRRTMTYDNGTEFSAFERIEQKSGFQVYFARPHSPWQRGCNENANGLLGQFFPKRRSLDGISKAKLETVVDLLNHRPRKRLGYRTPHEVLTQNGRVAIGT